MSGPWGLASCQTGEVCVCVCVCVYAFVHVCVRACVCPYVCLYVRCALFLSVRVCICTCVCLSVNVCVCTYLYVCDRYGRKKVVYGSILLKLAATFMTAFPINYPWLVITRFLLGMGSTGAYLTGFILGQHSYTLGIYREYSLRYSQE